ncbi:MAG: hypothetical protein N3B12_03885 [Armatimonadetes bacterium]|nr:hypothetical protein [Armatimonadota bacterium]
METLVSAAVLIGMIWAMWRGLKWMLCSGRTYASRPEPLTPADLRALEESAARLMADMRATADECVARIERACAEAVERSTNLSELIEGSDPSREIARRTGLMTGEVDLIRSLHAYGRPEHAGSAQT